MVNIRNLLDWNFAYVLGLLVLTEGYVLTRVALDNWEQCRRLCWYRAGCVAYSCNPQPRIAPSSFSCLLHGSPFTAADVPNGWVTKPANSTAITNSCQTRRCSETEVCLPGPYNSLGDGGYKCLPLDINCGAPSPRPINGTFSWTGTSLGQVATLICDPGFVLVPNATVVAPTITCLANGSWSALGSACHQTEFHSPAIPFNASFPSPLFYGWEACVMGTYLVAGVQEQMVYNFLTDLEYYAKLTTSDYKNVTLQVAFRTNFSSMSNYTAFSRKTSVGWEPATYAFDMPLTAGQPFNLTFALNSSGLDVVLRGTGWSAFCNYAGLTPPLDLTQIVYMAIDQRVTLQYVNTVSALPCL